MRISLATSWHTSWPKLCLGTLLISSSFGGPKSSHTERKLPDQSTAPRSKPSVHRSSET